ncbi:MAG: hypothetical protein F4X84_02060 [Synechococcus sp. SB0662_bin_45]|nr:hypothetical protein [Synechococcus sp. SB0668_bin_13]MYE21180.1 hypothetical protein [Synechococcus sp. SB0662_bin_45]
MTQPTNPLIIESIVFPHFFSLHLFWLHSFLVILAELILTEAGKGHPLTLQDHHHQTACLDRCPSPSLRQAVGKGGHGAMVQGTLMVTVHG